MELLTKPFPIFVMLMAASALLIFVINAIAPIDKSKIKPAPSAIPRLSPDKLEKVVELFRRMLDDGMFGRGPSVESHAFDTKLLPYPKAWIEDALRRALADATDDSDRGYYRIALRCLASFQEGIGAEPIRLPPDAGIPPEPDRWQSDELRIRAYEVGAVVEAARQSAMRA